MRPLHLLALIRAFSTTPSHHTACKLASLHLAAFPFVCPPGRFLDIKAVTIQMLIPLHYMLHAFAVCPKRAACSRHRLTNYEV